jgi:peptide deformylase
MAILPILEYPDPRLRLPARPVEAFGPDLARLVDDLCDTLRASGGIGLAAPQTGDRRQVLVIDLSGGEAPPDVYVNPVMLDAAVPGLVEESCLSVPGVVGNVLRATQLTVRARARDGAAFERRLEGMHAVCLQHEMDHLEGRLFVDRLSIFRRIGVRLGAAARARGRAAAV